MNINNKVDNLGKELFDYFVESEPVLATYFGIHKYDGLMPDGSPKRHLKDIKRAKQFLSEFRSIKSSQLSFEKRIDKEVAIHILKLFIFEEDKLRFWEKNPNEVLNIIGDSLFLLLSRDFAPIELRLKSIASRLKRTPQLLEETKKSLKSPVKLWTKLAIESCIRFPEFLKTIKAVGKQRLKGKDYQILKKGCSETEQAISDFKDYLEDVLYPSATEKFALGPMKFRKLLRLRELGLSSEEILLIGQRLLASEKRRLKRVANKIKPGAGVNEIREDIKSRYPKDFNEVIRTVKKSILEAKKFIIKKEFATIPENESLKVLKTPSFMRHIVPFAAYFPPAIFDKEKVGVYIVTPAEKNIERLKEHSFSSIINTSVHEGYPGHHLQLVCSATHPSLIRHLSSATEFVEGWAHYCEEELKNLGYIDLKTEFIQTLDAVWRAARIIIDVRLSSGEISIDEAVNFLIKNTAMERSAAQAEVHRYTHSPAYQLSYLLGKEMLKGLKEDLKGRLGDNFNERTFHDTLLYSGSLPIKYIRKICKRQLSSLILPACAEDSAGRYQRQYEIGDYMLSPYK